MTLVEMGLRLSAARKSKRTTQADLAALLGMSRATISGLENGTVSEIGIRKVMALCTTLGLELVVQDKPRRPTLQQLMAERDAA
jgi:HTH-type transcriptional regulator / antitoxin HipB